MLILIDNYDSFTWNLWHFLSDLGVEVITIRNDEKTVDEIIAMEPQAIVISPGPCTPYDAGICLDLIPAVAEANIPLMGVCLGFQAIGVAFGANIKRVSPPVHGKLSLIDHDGKTLLAECSKPIAVTRYHSLILDKETIPPCLEITALSKDGIAMGISHKTHNIHGVLFHPESIASVNGYRILANFLNLAGITSINDEAIIELEKHTLNLAERYPQHIHR